MTVKEVIDILKKLPQDKECVLAIDESAGFPDKDYIQVHPLESVYIDNLKSPVINGTKYSYYGLDENDFEKVLFYTFP